MNIFDAELVSEFFKEHYFLFLSGIFLGTFISVWYIIPKIIWVSNEKQLVKPVIDRSVHVKPIPTFGGVAFFITLILVLALVQTLSLNHAGNHLIAAATILFMVGLKDDLVVSTARVKFIGQLIAISFLVFFPDFELLSLHGFLGIEEIPLWLGYALAAFIMVAIINSYNLIDGIDGLASIAGIVIGTVYATLFYLAGQHLYVLVSMSLVGMLAGFLRYNFSRGSRKIFMGDSGALIIGLVIGFLTLKALSYSGTAKAIEGFIPENRILLVLAVLYIPFFDTTRSILIRLLNKKSPFEPDRNHTHHVLLDAGCTHMQATLILGLLNASVVGIFLVLSSFFGSWIMTGVMLAVFGISCWGFHLVKKAYPAAPVAVKTEVESAVSVEPFPLENIVVKGNSSREGLTAPSNGVRVKRERNEDKKEILDLA